MKSTQGQLNHLNHYEHLRRLYLFECVYGLITTAVAGIVIYAYNSDTIYLLLALAYASFVGFESFLLLRMKQVNSYHPLLAPRIFHFISMYLMVLLVGFYLPDIVCKFIILIPIGLSLMSLHPYFLKKYKQLSIGIGVVTGLALIASEIVSKRYQEPLSLENYIFLIYASLLVWLYTFLANGLTKTLKEKMQFYKSNLELQKQQTETANQKVGRMSHKLSLDFRNTLTNIDGKLEEVLSHCKDPQLKNAINSSRQETYKLAQFIDEFTNHKKSMNKPLIPEVFDISKLLLDTVAEHQTEIDEKNITTSIRPYTGELFPIDRNILQQVVRNMLVNAIEYADPAKDNKWIKINAYSGSGYFYLSISDNGIGIPTESKEDIFKMFYSTNKSTLNKGLGLYEVEEALKAVNGTVHLAENKNTTTFKVEIPIVSLN